MPMIEARGLTKMFPGSDRPAISEVDLTLSEGRVLAILGSNGAGKTTLLRMLTTLAAPTSGTAKVAGHDIIRDGSAVRGRIGVVGQYAAVDEVLSGRANLELFGRLLGLNRATAKRRAEELLSQFDLIDAADRPVGKYSGGMRRRIDLAVALICKPDVLFIDEPTTGLDPVARRDLWAAVKARVCEGTAVVLTTQYLEEADALADDVVILREGRVLVAGTSWELKRLAGEPRTEVREPTLEDLYLQLHTGPAQVHPGKET
ncbi:ABC transporter ATP-binding protein [Kocuria carniphila]|uniref:ABC transporter ATP-binding protein n=2 Tax=Kocuria carniphila TaxID=262208 RepID=UPI001EE78F20|nr:ATP-binding cassette domain-containing protein [Kocuria carniphila]